MMHSKAVVLMSFVLCMSFWLITAGLSVFCPVCCLMLCLVDPVYHHDQPTGQ